MERFLRVLSLIWEYASLSALTIALSMALNYVVRPLITPQTKWLYLHQDWFLAFAWLGIIQLVATVYGIHSELKTSNELQQKVLDKLKYR
jgi:hypothetical protein